MTDPVPPAADGALAELLEVSPQVDAAVILERNGGRLLSSAPPSSSRMADRFGTTCIQILDAAEQARAELGREPVAQVEVATPDGHVFVVADARWVVAAVTDADPTVGLVFYDLKSALRAVREARASGNGSNGAAPASAAAAIVTPKAKPKSKVASTPEPDAKAETKAAEAAMTSEGDDTGDDTPGDESESGGSGRWRRKNR